MNMIFVLFIICFGFSASFADSTIVYDYGRLAKKTNDVLPFDPALKPFYHGIASGDPLYDRVIIWTRITPDVDGPTEVSWVIAKDPACLQVVQSGKVITDQEKDYTVKVDISGLQSGMHYYYRFAHGNVSSLIGRTKTATSESVSSLRFGIASCANYQQGFFNAYAHMAMRNDLDAILFLGDYIYEYQAKGYGYSDKVGRSHIPEQEAVTLNDYRIRYSFYRLDPDLRRLHQLHPFIGIWDDHETANDSWPGGADNHQSTEGDWEQRKRAGKKAFMEWLPIREQDSTGSIYRTLSYGPLCELYMLDTRLEGRDKPIGPKDTTSSAIDTAIWQSPNRTLLGKKQYDWLTSSLKQTRATWKVIGNQVMLMPLDGFTNQDSWEGYPAERKTLLSRFRKDPIQNVIFVTGDIHSTWISELPIEKNDPEYQSATGKGSTGVEFVTPSITSANINELLNTSPGSLQTQFLILQAKTLNPHIKDVELDSHGYMILNLTQDKAQADWYFVDSTTIRRKGEKFYKGFQTLLGTNALQQASTAIATKPGGPVDPSDSPLSINEEIPALAIGNYPNPCTDHTLIHYVIAKGAHVSIQIIDVNGNEVLRPLQALYHEPGPYAARIDISLLPSGTYYYHLNIGTTTITRTMTIIH
ncbi:MAG: alkaline phosphatase D family protein [Ignavibacteria bacterium]